MIILTKRQKQLLEMMRDGEEMVIYGRDVWVGDERTSPKIWKFFIEHILISGDSVMKAYYHINESGKLLLEGRQDIYRMADGRYVEDWKC
jgi:hypothetical protein